TSNVQPPLAASCVTCHGGSDSTATNALDMRRVTDTSLSGQAVACAQLLNRVDLVTPAMSQIFLNTVPGNTTNHRLRYQFPNSTTYDAFVAAVTPWIVKEGQ